MRILLYIKWCVCVRARMWSGRRLSGKGKGGVRFDAMRKQVAGGMPSGLGEGRGKEKKRGDWGRGCANATEDRTAVKQRAAADGDASTLKETPRNETKNTGRKKP